MDFTKVNDKILRDLFLEGLQNIARELGKPIPTKLLSEGFDADEAQMIERNLADITGLSIAVHDGLLIAHQSVSEAIRVNLGTGSSWQEVEDSESNYIVMAPHLKELRRRLLGVPA